MTDAVAAGVLAFLSNRTSLVAVLITAAERFASRVSAASSATEQVFVLLALGLGDADALANGFALSP